MSDHTKIEWADATLNYVNGCSVVSPGCTNCYAMRLAGTRMKHHPSRAGLTQDSKAGPVWTGEVRAHEPALLQALKWQRPRRIFWNAHGDLFHDAVPDEWIDRLFAVAALTPQHTHMILTKRAGRMREYMDKAIGRIADRAIRMRRERGDNCLVVPLPNVRPGAAWWPLPNVWLGVSVEDQARADERVSDLLATPAAVRFLSCEPLLGEIAFDPCDLARIDLLIMGGESGPGARPMHPGWARSLRDQCAIAAGVPFFFKQWGDWAPVCEMGEQLLDDIYHPAPERDPEATRRCKVDQCVLHVDGARFNGTAMYERPAFEQGSGAMMMFAIGKKRAGRLLDGVEHNELPTRA